MNKIITFSEELLAPCGINCGLCQGYLAYSRNLPASVRKQVKSGNCPGCRPRNKQCAYLKGHCELIRKNQINFCFECGDFPCQRLQHLDERYRRNYHHSLINNLAVIKNFGISQLLDDHQKKYECRKCGGVVSVHDGRCYDCEVAEHKDH